MSINLKSTLLDEHHGRHGTPPIPTTIGANAMRTTRPESKCI